jgi:hypothetical protein
VETAETAMEMAPGALPYLGRVPEQRLLSPEIHRWRRRSCGTLFGNLPIILGFSVPKLFIGEGASSEGGPGLLTMGGRCQGLGRAPLWCGQPLAPLRLRLVLVLHPGKIGVSVFVLSNSENISCIAFLKHKNSKKQGTGTVASCQ